MTMMMTRRMCRLSILMLGSLAGCTANEDTRGSLSELQLCGRIALTAFDGHFVAAEGGGGRELVANRSAIGPWETFDVIQRPGGAVALRAFNGQYVVAEGGGGQAVYANRTAIGPWEHFQPIDRGSKLALRAFNGQHVVAEGGGGQALYANRTSIGPWEEFGVTCVDGPPPPPPPPPGACFVTRAGAELSLRGGRFAFVGVNLRGLAYQSPGQIQSQLAAAASFGARTIRVFAVRRDRDTAGVIAALDQLFAIAQSVDSELRFILSLQDFYGGSGYHVAGDDGFYSNNLLRTDWYTGGFRANYKPMVQALVARFGGEPRIAAWELGNELSTLSPDAAIALDFAYEMGEAIRGAGAKQLISPGIIGIHHFTFGGTDGALLSALYRGPWRNHATSPFGIGSIHAYNNNQQPGNVLDYGFEDIDIAWFVANGFPYYVGEGGFTGGGTTAGNCSEPQFPGWSWEGTPIPDARGNRGAAVRATIDKFFDGKGLDGYMQWGFMAGGDNGEGDRCTGMDAVFHGDFGSLVETYRNRANALPRGGSAPCR